MKRIDLDDLPPKLAALLAAAVPGEELLLVQNGAVIGRLTGAPPPPRDASHTDAPPAPEENAKEIFEQFRAMIEDEF